MTTLPATSAPGVVQAANPDHLLVRAIGVRQLAATIFNYTVGSGIFALPATAAAQLGPSAPVAYLACAVVMLLVVASFAEAGSRVSSTGGPYAYIETAFGPFVGLLAGVLLVVSALSGVAVVSTLFAGSALALVNIPSTPGAQAGIIVAVSAAAVLFNVCGVRWGVRVVEFMTAAKLVPLTLFVLVGAALGRVEKSAIRLALSRALRFLRCSVSAFSISPFRPLRRAFWDPRWGGTKITPLAAAAGAAVGEPGRAIMLGGATISMLGLLFGAGLVNPRIVFALARDGFLPRYIAGVHPEYRTPHRSIVLCAIVVVTLALTGTFERLLIISNISGLIVYGMVALAALLLQRRDVHADGAPFRCPGGALIHLLALGGVIAVLWAITSRQDLTGIAILLIASAAAYLLRRRSTPTS